MESYSFLHYKRWLDGWLDRSPQFVWEVDWPRWFFSWLDWRSKALLLDGPPQLHLKLREVCSRTPVLKKGDPTDMKNYRPVSCLVAASKILESVVCKQVNEFFEKNKLFPKNQHGFRKSRSTMTALNNLQEGWPQILEKNRTTGVHLWDLSAAFDSIDTELLRKWLEWCGFNQVSTAPSGSGPTSQAENKHSK